MRILLALLLAVLATQTRAAIDPCADPGYALTAGYSITERTVIVAGDTRWYCVVTPPGYSPSGPDYPFVIVLHGGGGNSTTMMEEGKGLMSEIIDRGYVAAFALGSPRDTCDLTDLPCAQNAWAPEENIDFINAILDEAARNNLDETRVYLLGFSGGARLIYRAIEADRIRMPITAIATAAGTMGAYQIDDPAAGVALHNPASGTSVHAAIMQGGSDPKMPFLGGLAEEDDELHVSFRYKVDHFRVLTGNAEDPGTAYPVADPDVVAVEYDQGTHKVLEVSREATKHRWRDWYSVIVFDWFETL